MLGVWGELASHKRLFNPPPRFSRLGTKCPAEFCHMSSGWFDSTEPSLSLMSCHVYLCMCFEWGL